MGFMKPWRGEWAREGGLVGFMKPARGAWAKGKEGRGGARSWWWVAS